MRQPHRRRERSTFCLAPRPERSVRVEKGGNGPALADKNQHRHNGASRARSPVNVVDSSGWLEYFAYGPNAGFFSEAIEAVGDLVVPTISVYEVFKRVLVQRGEGAALRAGRPCSRARSST